jgi:hypothetical protein
MRRYGLGKGTVLNVLREAGAIREQHRPSTAQLAEAAQLYAQGWSLVKLGEHFGFDQSTIWKGLTRSGVKMRRPWERGLSPA